MGVYINPGNDGFTTEIARDPSYHTHLNRYNVLYLDITQMISDAGTTDIVPYITERVAGELGAVICGYEPSGLYQYGL